MIYTLTLNPSVDYIVELEEVKLGELNRTKHETKFPGGKGINVSRLLRRMNMTSKALGFVGGFTGSYLKSHLHAEKIETDFVEVNEDTRINVKLKSSNETEINAKGPFISGEAFRMLVEKVDKLTSEDILILAGSIPSSMPKDTYEKLVTLCQKNGTKFVIDAEGNLLKSLLTYQPFLIKPNHHELGEFFSKTYSSCEDVIPDAKKLVEMGAMNVIVSLADKGAVFVNGESSFISNVPIGVVQSSVGAGDSMVAGFIATFIKSGDLKEAFRYSVASGSATAFSMGLASKEKIEELLTQVIIKEI